MGAIGVEFCLALEGGGGGGGERGAGYIYRYRQVE